MSAIGRTVHDSDASLVAEALDLAPDTVRLHSREPLGEGSVTGFVLGADEGVAYLDSSLMPVREETGLARADGVRVWLHPADPHLPALAPAAFGEAVDILLRRLGVAPARTVELVGYRPGRRGVLRVTTGDGDVWVKVVRPARVARIVDTHRALGAAGIPVPSVVGWSPDGLIVMRSARGTAVADAPWLPDPLLDEVDRLRGRLSAAPLPHPARTSLGTRLTWYVTRLEAVLPGDASPRAVAASAEPHLRRGADGTIHGDLHIGQLFVDDTGALSGLIDVDTAGTGDPADDSAAFVGHAVASALAASDTVRASRFRSLALAAEARWSADAATRSLTAVHLLGHALAAAERGDPAHARRLLNSARAAAADSKTGLIASFEGA